MKTRLILGIFAAVLLLGLSSCFLPPELSLEWGDLTYTSGFPTVYIHYWIQNTSLTTNLTNCKLELEITTDYPHTYDVWTSGVDLNASQTSGDLSYYYIAPGSELFMSAKVIGAGFDNPPDNNNS